jgi:hypothetical protein
VEVGSGGSLGVEMSGYPVAEVVESLEVEVVVVAVVEAGFVEVDVASVKEVSDTVGSSVGYPW